MLIEDTAKSLGDNIQFDYGRKSDFNVLRDKKYPFITLDPLNASASYADNNVSNYSKSYQASMAFYQLDKEESDQTQYACILDEMNELADKFINKLNFQADALCIDSDMIIITGMNQQPFIKATADILTGYIMNFTVTVTDDFNYCEVVC